MCLVNVTTKKPLIADDDIIVYKFIRIGTSLVDNWKYLVFHGDDCIAVILGETVKGKISINCMDKLFICTNDSVFNGNSVDDKFGYEYSWILDYNVNSIIVNGNEITKPCYETIYRNLIVKIGNEYTSRLILKNDENGSEVNIGLHSYIKKPIFKKGNILVECIIPKGSKYFIGEFDETDSIASDRLRYVKILDD